MSIEIRASTKEIRKGQRREEGEEKRKRGERRE